MEIDVKKIIIDTNICDLVYGYSMTENEFKELCDKIYDNIECLMSDIYKERYLENAIESVFVPAYDGIGTRYVRCIHCQEIKTSNKFVVYGGKPSVNEGLCYECLDKYERSDKNEKEYGDINDYFHSSNPSFSRYKS